MADSPERARGVLGRYVDLVVDVWNEGLMGMDIGRLVTAVVILAVFFALRNVFARILMRRVRYFTERSKTDVDDGLAEALEPPLRFFPLTLGVFLALEYLPLSPTLRPLADSLSRSLIIFTIFWAFYRAVDPFSALFSRLEKVLGTPLVEWLVKGIKAAFAFLGAAAILETWGIEVGPLLAGLGLFGVAVALGAQDMFKNLIAGMLIIAERRFNVGEWIRVEGVVEGTVENIGFRSSRIRRFDKAPVHVPNSMLSDNALVNFSKMSHRRIFWKIGVVYGTTVDQLKEIRAGIESHVTESGDFAQPPDVPLFVRVDSFGTSSIDILLYCFTKTTNWGEWLEIKEKLAYRVKEIVEDADSSFAFPSQSVYVESVPGERPELFVPPKDRPKRKKRKT